MRAEKMKFLAIFGVLIMAVAALTAVIPMITSDDTDAGSSVDIQSGENISTGFDRVVDTQSPTELDEFVLQWVTNKASSGAGMSIDWGSIPSTSVVTDGHVYTRMGSSIYKISLETGEEVATAPTVSGNYLYGHWLAYADHDGGMILDPRNATAYDLDLNQLFKFESGHEMMIYHNGAIYGISTYGTEQDPKGSITKYSADDSQPNRTNEINNKIWKTDGILSGTYPRDQYPVMVDNHGFAVGKSVVSFDLTTGAVLSSYLIPEGGSNNEPTYADGVLYLTTYTSGFMDAGSGSNGKAIAIPVNSDGTFDTDNIKTVDLSSSKNNSNLVPFNGFGYVLTPEGLHVIDLEDFTEVEYIEGGCMFSRGGITVSTGYMTDEDNIVYIYAVDHQDNRTMFVYKHVYTDNGDGYGHTLTRNVISPVGSVQFTTESVVLVEGGYILWHNDSGDLFCYKKISGDTTVAKGDVNMDGKVDLRDATAIAQYICGIADMNDRQLQLADYNEDGKVDLRDATAIARSVGYVFPVQFIVMDDNTEAEIDNATVTTYSDSTMKNKVTTSVLAPGIYYYKVSATGYDEAQGSFEITNETKVVTVRMVESDPESYFGIDDDGLLWGYTGPETDLVIPEVIRGITVTEISNQAFLNNTSLVTVTMPDSVTKIQDGAFYQCTGLKTVNLGKGLTSITKNIGDGMEGPFFGCTALESIIAHPDSTKYVTVTGVLYEKVNVTGQQFSLYLKPLVVPAGVKDVTVPANIYNEGEGNQYSIVPGGLFNGHSSLEYLYIEDGITIIRQNTFNNCIALKEVRLPSTLVSELNNAFNNSTSLQWVIIPFKPTIVNSFNNCTSLTSVVILEGMTELGSGGAGYGVFENCTSLVSVTLPKSLKTINRDVLTNAPIVHLDLTYVTSVNPNTLEGCTELMYITIGSGFNENIGGSKVEVVTFASNATWTTAIQNASANWTSLRGYIVDSANMNLIDGILYSKDGKTLYSAPAKLNVGDLTISDEVETISSNAFKDNTTLTSVTIPASVMSIGASAFQDCSGLKKVIFYGTSVPTLGENAFTGVDAIYLCSADVVFDWGGLEGQQTSNFYSLKFYVDGVLAKTEYLEIGEFPLADVSSELGVNEWWTSSDDTGTMYQSTELFAVTGSTTLYGTGLVISDKIVTGYTAKVKSLIIPTNVFGEIVESIGDGAFRNNKTITSVVIQDGVTISGTNAFWGCTSLTTVGIEGALTSIPASTFYGCGELISVNLPEGLNSIGGSAFNGCTKLDLRIPSTVETIGSNAFDSSGITYADLRNVSGTISIYGAVNLKTVIIGENVAIGMMGFNGCVALKEIYIIGASMKPINMYTFFQATSLPTIYCYGGEDSFTWNISGVTLVTGTFWYLTLVAEGEDVATLMIPNGTEVDLAQYATIAGYEVAGWEVGSAGGPDAGEAITITSDTELHAVLVS